MREIISPVEAFPGTVTLPDFLNLHQAATFEAAIEEVRPRQKFDAAAFEVLLPAINTCVIKWQITGQPEQPTLETYHATPLGPSNQLLAWLVREINTLLIGERTVPNASGSEPTGTQQEPAQDQ